MSGRLSVRDTFLVAAGSAAGLVRHPRVVESWGASSALPKMSVGALATHLAAQVLTTQQLVIAPPVAEAPITLLEHYARAAWVTAGLDDDANVSIRAGAESGSRDGAAALDAQVTEALSALRASLYAVREPDTVHLPWQGWSLSLDDYLASQMLEIIVHSDDLAVSVGIQTPTLPDQVLAPVLGLLVKLSVRKHGQASVVRALTRRERAPGDITAF